MKKIISLFLALLMAFSVVTVAFAEGEATEPETTTEAAPVEGEGEGTESVIPDLGEYDWILDLPFWTVGPAFKLAKIAFKLVSAYLKVAKIFGLVEEDMDDMILGAITDLIESSQNAENGGAAEEETTAPETTAAAA